MWVKLDLDLLYGNSNEMFLFWIKIDEMITVTIILSLVYFICELFHFMQNYLNMSYVYHFISGSIKWSNFEVNKIDILITMWSFHEFSFKNKNISVELS